jgi:hypothetical protein
MLPQKLLARNSREKKFNVTSSKSSIHRITAEYSPHVPNHKHNPNNTIPNIGGIL